MSTYEREAKWSLPADPSALHLYAWNAQMSAALLLPLHICEVVIRNAVSDVLVATYGANWPWEVTFERSLPAAAKGYCQVKDLQMARKGVTTVGKVIPELKFIFWQKMFTSRHDVRLWDVHLRSVMLNAPLADPIRTIRKSAYDSLEQIRLLRNRIAHHEPIFSRNLADDIEMINKLVMLRSRDVANWMKHYEQATFLLANKP
ncbi:hypothetical protein ACFQ0F_08325 [Paraperlucidibaca wandonensis]|uniref:Abi-like protein n=1 Tax=Paraperlucidibaca wandonensis TaxID=1268273 RepID=A0ABW3HGQ9_9GAMM